MSEQKRNYVILGSAGFASLAALIIGIFSIFKKVIMGSIFVFDSGWNKVFANSIISYKNVVVGFGLVGLMLAVLLLIGIAFVAWKQFKGSEMKLQILIGIAVLSAVVLVFATIAFAFNLVLNNSTWIAKQQMHAFHI